MKLDRNNNPDGSGKYALLKIRRLSQIYDEGSKPHVSETHAYGLAQAVKDALGVLDRAGLIHWGSEGAGEQFFVMKYKDKFSAAALLEYHVAARREAEQVGLGLVDYMAKAISGESLTEEEKKRQHEIGLQYRSLRQYSDEIHNEYLSALEHGSRMPD